MRTFVPLGELIERVEAGKSLLCEPRPAALSEWGVIKVSAMTYGTFRENEQKAVPSSRMVDSRYEIQAGDLLVSRANTTDYVGASVLVGAVRPRLLLSDKSLRLVPRAGVAPRWLHLMLQSPPVRSAISVKASGTKDSMRNISQKALLATLIPLVPLAEQHHIIAVLEDHLSQLDAADNYLHSAITRSTTMASAYVVSSMLGGHSDFGRARQAVAADAEGLPNLLEGWRWSRLGQLCDVVGGVTKDAAKQQATGSVEVPYLRVANVQRGRLDLNVMKSIRVSAAKAAALRLLPGDVLMNEGGDRDKLGRGWIWSGELDSCIHQNHVFRARVRDRAIRPKLLSYWANTVGGEWCERHGRQSVNLASIGLRRIREMPVPVPPIDEQESLENAIDATQYGAVRLTATSAALTKRAACLRRELLSAAFAGRLTEP